MSYIKYPFIPADQTIQYVTYDDYFMQQAKKAKEQAGCIVQPTGGILVLNEKIIARGNNAGELLDYCPRHQLKMPTGAGYSLCKKYCKQFGHAEVNTIYNALKTTAASEQDLSICRHLIDHCFYENYPFTPTMENEISEFFNYLKNKNIHFAGASFYLDGHWWICRLCWTFLLAVGVTNFYLLNGSEKLYNLIRK